MLFDSFAGFLTNLSLILWRACGTESIWLADLCLGVHLPRTKIKKNVKKALPKDELNAIIGNLSNISLYILSKSNQLKHLCKSFFLEYSTTFWKTQHNMDLNMKAVTSAITTKLLSEHTAQRAEDAKLAAQEATAALLREQANALLPRVTAAHINNSVDGEEGGNSRDI